VVLTWLKYHKCDTGIEHWRDLGYELPKSDLDKHVIDEFISDLSDQGVEVEIVDFPPKDVLLNKIAQIKCTISKLQAKVEQYTATVERHID